MHEPTKNLEQTTWYDKDQYELGNIYSTVIRKLEIAPLDPDQDYIINVGCGMKPDQIALQVFSDKNKPGQIPVVGISVELGEPFMDEALANTRPGDRVELIQGDAAVEIPGVVVKRGKPKIIVARNPDAMFIGKPNDPNPLLRTSWKDVFQSVYDALSEDGGFFVVTYKNSQEMVPIVAYMNEAGFLVTPIEKDDRRSEWQKLRDFFSVEPPVGKVESDQFVIVGIKNIPDNLLARLQQSEPGVTRESLKAEWMKVKSQVDEEKKGRQIEKRYRAANKYLDGISKDRSVRLLMNFIERQELDLTNEQIQSLNTMSTSPGDIMIIFTDFDSLDQYESLKQSSKPVKPNILRRGEQGYERKLFSKDSSGVVLGHTVFYNYPSKKETPTGHQYLPEGEVVKCEIVRVFIAPDKLADLEKFIEIDKALDRPETRD